MNYEEKYKQALERAVLWHKSAMSADKKAMVEDLFPELKESEDEKIRKTLIEYIKGIKSWNYFLGISKEQMIAWLEKQGEKKMVNAGKVIEWLNHRELGCCDVVTTVIPDDSPTSIPQRVKWLSDEFIEQFKKDFGL